MGDYGFDRAQIHLLEDQRRYDQAAEVAFSERNIVEGIRLLLRSDSSTSMRKTIKYALYGLWTVLPLAFGPPGDKLQNAAIASLVQYLRSDKLRVLNRDETYQVSAKISWKKFVNPIYSLLSLKSFKPYMRMTRIVCFPLLRRMEDWHRNPTLTIQVAICLPSFASHIARPY